MKRLLIVLSILLPCAYLGAQEKKSNFETFCETTGTLLQRETVVVDSIKGYAIDVVRCIDLSEANKSSAIRIKRISGKSNQMYIAYIDSDELPNLINAFNQAKIEIKKPKTKSVYEAYSFRCRGGLALNIFFMEKAGVWMCAFELQNEEQERPIIKLEDFNSIISIIEKAKNQL